ncbi:MAG: UvrD-helicase domain-containing protein, partial [Pseudomonadota bacterium]
MTSVELLADASERDQALDIERSFIMQAPAGSGKTGVLTQRILKLLAVVERPEQILAITFTKKAAAEMQHRVMSALQNAAADVPPENEHDQLYDQLARQVLQRDRQRQWNLLDNPGRLRLQTIDSLCSSIVRDNPLAARLGVQFNVADDASDCYSEAARSLLASLDEDSDLGRALYRVLGFLDSQYRKLNQLIGQMLAQRDHWLHDVAASQHNWDGFR